MSWRQQERLGATKSCEMRQVTENYKITSNYKKEFVTFQERNKDAFLFKSLKDNMYVVHSL